MGNWYQVLEVSQQASEEEIKASYRKLAKKYHPDAHPGDKECEKRFKEISEAYSILSDQEKRKKYDAELSRNRQSGHSGKESKDPHMSRTEPVDFQNVQKNFEKFFGFNPETKDIVNEDKLKTKKTNPLDASDLFEKFMGIKR